MTDTEHNKACYTAGHMQHLAGIAYKAGVLSENEKSVVALYGQKLYTWLQSLPEHIATETHPVTETPEPTREQRQLEACKEALAEWQERQQKEHRIVWRDSGPLGEQLRVAFRRADDVQQRALTSCENIRTQVITWMRALAIIANGAINAHTHKWKDNRLTILIEQIEAAIGSLTKERIESDFHGWRENIFASSYPIQHYLDKIEESRREISYLKQELAQVKGEKPPETEALDIPF